MGLSTGGLASWWAGSSKFTTPKRLKNQLTLKQLPSALPTAFSQQTPVHVQRAAVVQSNAAAPLTIETMLQSDANKVECATVYLDKYGI